MKSILLIISFIFILGCQESQSDLKKKYVALKNEVIASQEEYKELLKEVESLKVDSAEYDADYEKGQKILEEQDARYNALLSRWEKQADKMDKILEAQAKQYKVQL